MKKLFALMLALVMMMSVVAVAEEAVPSPKAGATIGSFTPDGIVPGVINAEDDETLQKLVTAVEEAGDNDTVFGSMCWSSSLASPSTTMTSPWAKSP